MSEQTDNPESSMPYWLRSQFHVSLSTVPLFQNDEDGTRIARANDHFCKIVDGVLYGARVPEDLSLPTNWVEMEEFGPLTNKAKSMLGASNSNQETP